MSVKKIGFVDDDLDNFHANTYLDAIRGPLLSRGWQVTSEGLTDFVVELSSKRQ